MKSKDILEKTSCDKRNLELHYDSLMEACKRYDINTENRFAAFLANILHETGMLKAFQENLNYSAKGLLATFPTRVNAAMAKELERDPERIANFIYGGRFGNTDAGDGWRYRGRGAFQVTFKDNYNLMSKALKEDFVSKPELLALPPYAMLSAGFYWHSRKLNKLADDGDIKSITRAINGGLNGYEHRKELYDKLLR